MKRYLSAILAFLALGCTSLSRAEGLPGVLYDLKRNNNGAPSALSFDPSDSSESRDKIRGALELLQKFYKKGNPKILAPFYKAKQDLQAAYFYQPPILESNILSSITTEQPLQPGGLLFVYNGYVKAPKSGTFRFIGMGDDGMVVRFNGKTVLEVGYFSPSLFSKASPRDGYMLSHKEEFSKLFSKHPVFKGYEAIPVKGCETWNKDLGGLFAGKPFQVKEGEVYPISISFYFLNGNEGGIGGFILYIEDTKDKVPAEKAYDLFRTGSFMPDIQALKAIKKYRPNTPMPDFNPESPVWEAVPAPKKK